MNGPSLPEALLEPAQVIVDAHHHLYDRPDLRYLVDDYLADIASGHDVRGSVFVQARMAYAIGGASGFEPVGETEFALDQGTRAGRRGHPGVAAAIVSHADLTAGDSVRPLLEAHVEAGAGRVRGIRQIAAWDEDESLLNPAYPTSEGMLESSGFLRGFAHLAPLDLSFDAWLYFHQLPRLAALARRFPETPIILNHCGGILGAGRFAGRREEVFEMWCAGLHDLAQYPNVTVKLSGLGMSISGFGFDARNSRPSAAELALAWEPWFAQCLSAFGTERAMFASNFPADRVSYDYRTGWNAMKRLSADCGADEKDALFWRNAARVYRLDSGLLDSGLRASVGSATHGG